jgi:arylsulfatase A-like enzyme
MNPAPGKDPWRLAASGVVAALLAAAGCTSDGTATRQAEPPDVVVIMIDTLRPDHLGFYGYPRETAPFLARLAERSAVFRRAYSTSSWTAPATASLLTSLYPVQHRVTEGFFAHQKRAEQVERQGKTTIQLRGLSASVETLPEIFRGLGYRTYGLSANVNIGSEMGFDRGFDRFERLHGLSFGLGGTAEELQARLADWENEIRESGPDFVYVHFNDVHAPYERRLPWYEEKPDKTDDLRSAYDSEISYLDRALARVFERFGWEREAIVVVLSDHGEEFMEHGQTGHKPTLYRELVQILAMIHAPDHGVEPGEITDNVSIVDLLPTVLELAGFPGERDVEGRSLVPLLADRPERDRLREELGERPLFAHRLGPGESPTELWAVIHGDRQLIEGGQRLELYDLANDPMQRSDRSKAESETVAQLRIHLEELRRLEPRPGAEASEVELDEEELERLRSLGYVN